ncbi:MAG TPA: hypothetical protein PKX93_10955, partial [bacterium]|nr:hypothetical protein [bacterium]
SGRLLEDTLRQTRQQKRSLKKPYEKSGDRLPTTPGENKMESFLPGYINFRKIKSGHFHFAETRTFLLGVDSP